MNTPTDANWRHFGALLREFTLEWHDGELIDIEDQYCFLLDNPQCFGNDEWPPNMPARPPKPLADGYHNG